MIIRLSSALAGPEREDPARAARGGGTPTAAERNARVAERGVPAGDGPNRAKAPGGQAEGAGAAVRAVHAVHPRADLHAGKSARRKRHFAGANKCKNCGEKLKALFEI